MCIYIDKNVHVVQVVSARATTSVCVCIKTNFYYVNISIPSAVQDSNTKHTHVDNCLYALFATAAHVSYVKVECVRR